MTVYQALASTRDLELWFRARKVEKMWQARELKHTPLPGAYSRHSQSSFRSGPSWEICWGRSGRDEGGARAWSKLREVGPKAFSFARMHRSMLVPRAGHNKPSHRSCRFISHRPGDQTRKFNQDVKCVDHSRVMQIARTPSNTPNPKHAELDRSILDCFCFLCFDGQCYHP